MSRKHNHGRQSRAVSQTIDGASILAMKDDSFLDRMVEGREYHSIISAGLEGRVELGSELRRALGEIEAARGGRPCIAYIGNVIRPGEASSVQNSDELPFAEMVDSVNGDARGVDVLLVTGGGSGQQIVRFVERLRKRFDDVQFLLPSLCMSAGTLFALSGNEIWMDDRASLGPIDPQVPTKDGRFVPAQALLALVTQLEQAGQQGLASGTGVPWSAVRLIDTLDKKELGDAITASGYALNMAKEFLAKYKFAGWTVRETSGAPVTDEYRLRRAQEVAEMLVSHDRWKSHGHSITRDVLQTELRLKIQHPDGALQRAMRRTWALCHWFFDKTPIQKMFAAANYAYFSHPAPEART